MLILWDYGCPGGYGFSGGGWGYGFMGLGITERGGNYWMFGLRNNYGKDGNSGNLRKWTEMGCGGGVKNYIIHAILLETKRFTIRGMCGFE